MLVLKWSVLRRGAVVGVFALSALATMPATSSGAGFDAFRPQTGFPFDVDGVGENGWFTSRGTITYRTEQSHGSSQYKKYSLFGEPLANVYVTYYKRVGDCLVNGEEVPTSPSVDGDQVEWVIPVPIRLGPGDFSDGRYTFEGTYDVDCTTRHLRTERTVWLGFIPEETETKTWEEASHVEIKIDTIAPSVTAVPRSPAARDPQGTNWHNAATVLDVAGTDGGSGISWCAGQPIGGPAGSEDKTALGQCRNNAGTLSEVSYVYRFDDEAPESDVTVPPSRGGWHRGDSRVTWGWSDRLSGTKPDGCPESSTPNGEGEAVQVDAACTDWAGNQQSASRTLKVDATAPTITLAGRSQPNAAGWHNTEVVVDWSCADELSGPEAETTSHTVADEGADISVTGACLDVAGNLSSDTQSGIKLDKTPPTAAPAVTGRQGRDGWYVSPVSVLWNWSDALSRIVDEECRPSSATEREGAGQRLEAQCADVADNLRTASRTVDVDLADPQITATVDREPSAGGWHTAPVTIRYACADPGQGSGLPDGACPQDVTVGEEGVTTVARSVSDRAGRGSTVSTTVKVDLNDPTIAAAADRGPDVEGWYTSPVTVTFTCSDPPPGSGIADCPVPVTVADEGDRTITGQARDRAGRRSAEATADVRLDLLPPDATIARRGAAVDLDAGRLTGTAIDGVSGVREVAVRWTHPSRGPEMVVADIECTDATRRVCTWWAKVPPARGWDVVVVATDRVGREDPTPDARNSR